ncbi:MAG: class I SAM-dependent methyltransferase [Inquilinus sp.]|nr:class I SAM-dependent methyltransferase [Inquilinus sp.]
MHELADSADALTEREFHNRFYADEFERIHQGGLQRRKRAAIADFLVSLPTEPSSCRVLSLGCGVGDIEIMAAPGLGEIVGIDISDVGISQAASRARAAGVKNVRFETGDCADLGAWAEDGSGFDMIWALGFLHHIDDAEMAALLGDCFRLLKPGGLLVSADPSARRMANIFKPFVRSAYEKYHSPDERELELGRLRRHLIAAGFATPRILYHDFFVGPLGWVVPGIPDWLATPLWHLDRLLRSTPGLRAFANAFISVARKPAGGGTTR